GDRAAEDQSRVGGWPEDIYAGVTGGVEAVGHVGEGVGLEIAFGQEPFDLGSGGRGVGSRGAEPGGGRGAASAGAPARAALGRGGTVRVHGRVPLLCRPRGRWRVARGTFTLW